MSEPTPNPVPEPTPVTPPAETAPAHHDEHHHDDHHHSVSPLKKLWKMLVRIYSGALLLAVLIVCMMAIIYLFKSVFAPAQLPKDFATWQGQLDPSALKQADVPGITGDAGRSPMGHYHKVQRWFQPDPGNACLSSGCHDALPHGKELKIGAFANLHVTFMDCRVCHEKVTSVPLAAGWVGTQSQSAQDAPPVLSLVKLLENYDGTKEQSAKVHPEIIGRLKTMFANGLKDTELEDLAIQIETSQPASPMWKKSVTRLAQVLPMHARGEYVAKIIRQQNANTDASMRDAAEKLTAAGNDKAKRDEIVKSSHGNIEPKPNACLKCHTTEAGMLDFASLGYSPRRVQELRTLPLARMVEDIRRGESFQLPKLLESEEK